MKRLKKFSGMSKFVFLVLMALGMGAFGIAFAIGTSIVEMTGSVGFQPFLTYDIIYETDSEGNLIDTGNVQVSAHPHPDRKNNYTGGAIIPETVELDNGKTYTVTKVPESAFKNCPNLTSITLPKTITAIGSYAFQGCTSLSNVTLKEGLTANLTGWNVFHLTKITSLYIPSGVKSIAGQFLGDCDITYLNVSADNENYRSVDNCIINNADVLVVGTKASIIPDYVTGIAGNAFRQRGLKEINIPDSAISIGANAFYGNTGLDSITIPASVTSIGAGAFSSCGLTLATFENTLGWSAKGTVDNVSYSHTFTRYDMEDEGVTASNLSKTVSNNGYANLAWTCLIPDEDNYPMLAFTYDDENLTASVRQGTTTPTGDVEIPARVTHGGKVYKVTSIDEYNENSGEGFYNCTGLTSIYIPETITKIGDRAFFGCTNLASISLSARNSTYSCENNAVYSGTTLVLGCKGTTEIRESTTAIGNYAFIGSGITSITIPANVTSIGVCAFYDCEYLETFTFAENSKLDSIGVAAFGGAGITEISLPTNLTTIGALAFSECGLSSLIVPASVNIIGFAAFGMNSTIPSVTFEKTTGWTVEKISSMPDSIIDYEDWTAGQATAYLALEDRYFVSLMASGYNFIWSETATMLAFTDNGDNTASVASAVGSDGKKLATGDISLLENVYFGSESWGTITSIGQSGFSGCKGLTSIIIPNTVTEINNSAFENCSNLASVNFSTSLKTIGERAFYNCNKLTSIDLPTSLETISHWAFRNCIGLTSLYLPQNVRSLNADAFQGCTGIESLTVANSNSKYESEANGIYGKNKTNLVLGCKNTIIREGTTSIDNCAFQEHTEISSIEIPETVTSIGNYAFGWGGLTSVEIPASVKTIGKQAFASTPLTSVTFGEGSQLEAIGVGAFQGCNKLTSITIPENTTSIGANAFTSSGLTSATFENPYGWNVTLNNETSKLTKVDLIANGVTYLTDTYKTYTWTRTSADDSEYEGLAFTVISEEDKTASVRGTDSTQTIIDIPDKVTCTGLTYGGEASWGSVGETYTITEVAAQGFYEYKKMTSLTLPDTIVTINAEAFKSCTGLTSLYIPDSVITIRGGAFNACTNVTTLRLSNNVETIGSWAFNSLVKLTELYLPASLKDFSGLGFPAANSLTSVIVDSENKTFRSEGNCVIRKRDNVLVYGCASSTIPEDISSIANFAFYSSTIASVTLPDGITLIGESAFASCKNITTITIPVTVNKIGANAFLKSGLTTITFGYKNGWSASGTVDNVSYSQTFTEDELEANAVTYLTTQVKDGGYADIIWTCDHTPDETTYPMLAFTYDEETLTASVSSKTNSSGTRIATGVINVPEKVAHDSKIYTVTSVADSGFEGCSITKMTLPNTITKIGACAFMSCSSLTGVNIPDNVTTIGESAFEESTITAISIPKATTTIGKYILKRCSQLEEIQVAGENPKYYSYNNGLYQGTTLIAGCKGKEGTTKIKDGTTTIGEYAFYDITGLVSIAIPDSVTEICDFAFSGCTGLKTVTISESSMLETIAPYAFLNCNNLETIELPDSLTKIYDDAFQGCSSLERITIPARVETIGSYAFSGCSSLKYVIFEDPTNWIVGYTVLLSEDLVNTTTAKDYLTSTYVYSNWTHTIKNESDYTMLKFDYDKDNLTASVSSREDTSGKKIASGNIEIPGIVKQVQKDEEGKDVLYYYKVTSVAFQGFYQCNLTSVVLPNTITLIGDEAFFQAGLTSAYLPASFEESNGNPVFGNNISTIAVDEANTKYYSINNGVYFNATSGGKYFVGKTLLTGSLNTIIESDTVNIAERAFRDVQITSITLPSTLKMIGAEAFEGCPITSITIPMNVEFIGKDAFQCFGKSLMTSAIFEDPMGWTAGSKSLSTSYLADASTAATYLKDTYVSYDWTHEIISANDLATKYPMLAFLPGNEAGTAIVRSAVDENDQHIALGDITVPDYVRIYVDGVEKVCKVTTVGQGGFYNSAGLTSITLPNTITTIEDSAFSLSTNLVSVKGGSYIKEIGDSAFAGCTSLKTIKYFTGYSSMFFKDEDRNVIIGDSAFSGCTSLESFTISLYCSYIGYGAFSGCTSLNNVYFNYNHSRVNTVTYYWQLEGDNNANAIVTIDCSTQVTSINASYLTGAYSLYSWMYTSYPKLRFVEFNDDAGTCAVSYSKDQSGNILSTGEISIPSTIQKRGKTYDVTWIAENGFKDCTGLTYVNFKNSQIRLIKENAFTNCTSFTKLELPKSVTVISSYAFLFCPFELMTVDSENSTYYSNNNGIYKTSSNGKDELAFGCVNTTIRTDITVTIGVAAFRDVKLTSIKIPSNVTSIGPEAFRGCTKLTEITISSGVTYIGIQAFCGCSKLTEITIPSSVDTIMYQAFEKCSKLDKVYLGTWTWKVMGYGYFDLKITGLFESTKAKNAATYLKEDYVDYVWYAQ